MKRNKKFTYPLLILVVLIWGSVFYRIFTNFSDKTKIKKIITQPSKPTEDVKVDSVYSLSLNYPDPFLKRLGETVNADKSNSKKQMINWPPVEYHGILSVKGKKKCAGLLKVENKNLLAQEGSIYSGIKVLVLNKDSVSLEYQKDKKWIKMLK